MGRKKGGLLTLLSSVSRFKWEDDEAAFDTARFRMLTKRACVNFPISERHPARVRHPLLPFRFPP